MQVQLEAVPTVHQQDLIRGLPIEIQSHQLRTLTGQNLRAVPATNQIRNPVPTTLAPHGNDRNPAVTAWGQKFAGRGSSANHRSPW